MKELSIEEKARRYDEAIEIAKEINNEQRAQPFNVMTRVFPELAESEDERMKEAIIATIYLYYGEPLEDEAKEMIAWLEKQGQDGKVWFYRDDYVRDKKQAYQDGIDNVLNNPQKYGLEKQGEQKKVYNFHGIEFIPKYVNGDLIREKKTGKRLAIESFSYDTGLYTYNGGQFPITIQDNYELVEQKPVEWSEEDETNIGRAIDIIKDAKEGLLSYKTDDGIYECEQAIKVLDKLLKNGYSVLWKEADYDNIEKLIKILPQCIFRHPHILERDECLKLVSWLKSLRPQKKWKPSDEQIKAVRLARSFVTDDFSDNPTLSEILIELEEQLKKLREE